ncbi:uncharacterized protein [Chelonus insularis]|uniref:uncharacterized protein n=1 Tax=Chelonus insularis TaxID=460826 RepID=UPI00158CDE6C|nr:uncharacterized protein LOC118071002 [Chelonus insularis]
MEFVQLSEAYKSVKSLKYHRQKHWGRRPQWHLFPHSPRRRLRRRRFKSRYNHEKYRERYPYHYAHNQRPFTIELELPDHHDDHQEPWRSSRENVRYSVPEVYEEEEEDRKVRIKVVEEGKSHIRLKISRNDYFGAEQNVNNMHNNSVPIESIAYSKTPLHRTEYTVPIVHSWNRE